MQPMSLATSDAVCPSLGDADLCLPCGLARLETRTSGLVIHRRRLERGDALFRQGDPFGAIHAVRAGSLKTVIHAPDGGEQVASFHWAGEILGLDAIARERHETTAVALEDAEVLVLPYPHAFWWEHRGDGLHALIVRLLSREMVRERDRLQLLSLRSAESRLAVFLLDLSRRMRGRGFSPVDFVLRATRAEIGSYLGLTLETVSRAFGSLQRRQLLQVDGKQVHLRDLGALKNLEGVAALA
jgi:CRP/FNR family transcriptional regulator, anaerobic regulatory protein